MATLLKLMQIVALVLMAQAQVGAGFCVQVNASIPHGVRWDHIRLFDEVAIVTQEGSLILDVNDHRRIKAMARAQAVLIRMAPDL